jgi:hypothetical protein
MVKPQVGGRVPQDLKDEFDEFAEENSLSHSDALRRLLRRGLEVEDAVAADGGEVVDRLDELEEMNRKEKRRENYQTALIGLTIVVGAFIWSGVASGLLVLLAGLALGGALIGLSLKPYLRRGVDDE